MPFGDYINFQKTRTATIKKSSICDYSDCIRQGRLPSNVVIIQSELFSFKFMQIYFVVLKKKKIIIITCNFVLLFKILLIKETAMAEIITGAGFIAV